MSNEAVIRAFMQHQEAHTPMRIILNGVYENRGCTLTSTSETLINYTTKIAEWTNDNTITLNTKHYSVTTSKIQNKIRMLAKEYNLVIKEVK